MNNLLNRIVESIVDDITLRVIEKVEANLETKINSAIAEHFKNKLPTQVTGDVRKTIIELIDNDSDVQNSIKSFIEDAGYIDEDEVSSKIDDAIDNLTFDVTVNR
jgi:hypothetical protein